MWHVRNLATLITVFVLAGSPQAQAASPALSGLHAVNPPAAMAPLARNNSIRGYTHKDASWAHYGKQRHHTSRSDITFQPDNLSSGGVCIRLHDITHGGYWPNAHGVCWTDHSKKFLGTNVPAMTFTVDAHKIDAQGADTFWSGTMFY